MNTYRSSLVWARWTVGVGALGALLTCSASAAALPLVGVSATVRGLYGAALGDSQQVAVAGGPNGISASSDLSPYGWGLGLRGGVTLFSVYAGVSFDYFFSESVKLQGFEVEGGNTQVMGNLGYELSIPLITLRPFLGVGYGRTRLESKQGFDSATDRLVIAPGAELLVSLGIVNVSGELRYNLANTADALVIGIGTGISF